MTEYKLSPQVSAVFQQFLDDHQVGYTKDAHIYILLLGEDESPKVNSFLQCGKKYIHTCPEKFSGTVTLVSAGTFSQPIMDDDKLKPEMRMGFKSKKELVDLLNGFEVGGYKLFNGEGMDL